MKNEFYHCLFKVSNNNKISLLPTVSKLENLLQIEEKRGHSLRYESIYSCLSRFLEIRTNSRII